MLKEFQDAAEKAHKKEKLNHIMLVVTGFVVALGLALLIHYTILHPATSELSHSSVNMLSKTTDANPNVIKKI